jgi:hypothetical protein
LEKLVGLAAGIPATLASATIDAAEEHDDGPMETEIYLEDAELEKSTVAQGTPNCDTSSPPIASPCADPGMDNENTTPSSPSEPSTPTSSVSSTNRPCDINASKDILTEGQAFAYVGLCLVTANTFFQAFEGIETAHAKESLESFVSKLVNRLYRHLDIDANSKSGVSFDFSTAHFSHFVVQMTGGNGTLNQMNFVFQMLTICTICS